MLNKYKLGQPIPQAKYNSARSQNILMIAIHYPKYERKKVDEGEFQRMFTNEKSANKIKGFSGKKDENQIPVSAMERISGRKEGCPACHHSHVTFYCCLRRGI